MGNKSKIMKQQTQTSEANDAVKSLIDIDNSTCHLDSYKQNPMFVINKDSRYPFSFGLAKARLIVKHYPKLRHFVATEGESLS